MPVTVKLRFPGGRYHATPWGRHVNEGVPEWPPSPWRFLRALIAVWKRTLPELPEPQVKRILSGLIRPPDYFLPPSRVAHTRHYMPWEKKGPADRALVFDTFVDVGHDTDTAVHMHWSTADISDEDRTVLASLVNNLSSLGRAESWVLAELVDYHSESNCSPSPGASSVVPVLCADPLAAFGDEFYPKHDPKKLAAGKIKSADFLFDCPPWHLCIDTETIHSNRLSGIPGAVWVNYSRPPDAAPKPRPVAKKSNSQFTVARFLLDGPVLPLTTDTIGVAEVMRGTVMHHFEKWCRRHPEQANQYRRTDCPERFASPTLSGKTSEGKPLDRHGHAFYLPSAESDDKRRLTHITVYARDGFNSEEVAAFSSVRTLRLDEKLEVRVQLVGLGLPAHFNTPLFNQSTTWTSVTPFLGPSHIGMTGRDRYMRKALKREWLRLADQIAEYHGIGVKADVLTPEQMMHSGMARPVEFVRTRRKHGSYRPAASFRVEFSRPVTGPICLGYASHFGLGRFEPAD